MKLLPRSAEWLGLEEQFLGNKEARSTNTVQPINRHLSSLFWPGSRVAQRQVFLALDLKRPLQPSVLCHCFWLGSAAACSSRTH